MKKTIKLRDLTEEQYKQWASDHCVNFDEDCVDKVQCGHCPFNWIACQILGENSHDLWTVHKDLYSDKFLDQTIEIEVPDLLTEEEKELLKDFDYFSLNSLTAIKIRLIGDSKLLTLYHGSDDFYVEFYVKNYLFKGLTEDNIYRVSDLGLEVK